LGVDEYYLSGDYAAATDNLAPWVSETIALAIADEIGLKPVERKLFVDNLIHNIINLHDGGSAPQRWGQLMGSVISFPILCIANAAMCRWSLEVDKDRSFSLSNTSLMINGDDVVFRTTKAGHKIWERMTAFVGLETSLGKTFLTKAFAQINSTNFKKLDTPVDEYDSESGITRQMWFKQGQYINLGLLYGLKRSGEKVGLDVVADAKISLGARCRDLIRNCPLELRESVMRLFLSHHRQQLNQLRDIPWFVPEALGGVGLPTVPQACETADLEPYGIHEERPIRISPLCRKTKRKDDVREFQWGPSRLDLQIANKIVRSPRDELGKLKYPVGKAPVEAPWATHRLVMQRLPIPLKYSKDIDHEVADNWKQVYAAMCYDVFASDERVFETPKEGATRVLWQNANSWRAARVEGGLPPPLLANTLNNLSVAQPFLPCRIRSLFSEPMGIPWYPERGPTVYNHMLWT